MRWNDGSQAGERSFESRDTVVVGLGHAGRRIVERFQDGSGATAQRIPRIGIVTRAGGWFGGVLSRPGQGTSTRVIRVAGLGARSGADLAEACASARVGAALHEVMGVFALPLNVEGTRRERALHQAERIVRRLRRVELIDTEDARFRSPDDERLSDYWDRVDEYAATAIARLVGLSVAVAAIAQHVAAREIPDTPIAVRTT